MTEPQQQLAALHAVGALPPGELDSFHQTLHNHPELRRESNELSATAANFLRLIPAIPPPADCKSHILTAINQTPVAKSLSSASSPPTSGPEQSTPIPTLPTNLTSPSSAATQETSQNLQTNSAPMPETDREHSSLSSVQPQISSPADSPSPSPEPPAIASSPVAHPPSGPVTAKLRKISDPDSKTTITINPSVASTPSPPPQANSTDAKSSPVATPNPAAASPTKSHHPLPTPPPNHSSGWTIFAWLLTLLLGIATSWLWSERKRLQKDLASEENEFKSRELLLVREQQQAALQSQLQQSQNKLQDLSSELEKWQKQSMLSSMQIAKLDGTTDDFRHSIAVAVWDPIAKQGVLVLEGLPQPQDDTDYQLWILDPNKKQPVSAGIIALEYDGSARIDFKPSEPIDTISKYNISIEKKGGVTKGVGPIVLIGP